MASNVNVGVAVTSAQDSENDAAVENVIASREGTAARSKTAAGSAIAAISTTAAGSTTVAGKSEDVGPADSESCDIMNVENSQPKTRFTCNYDKCRKSFSRIDALNIHVKSAHLGLKPYTCGVCSETFATPVQKQRHCQLAHPGPPTRKTAENTHCELCGKTFRDSYNLKAHLRTHFGVQESAACPECGAKFAEATDLRKHMTVHSEAKPFTCDECGQEFKWRNSWRRHVLTHSGGKQLECSYGCGVRFHQKCDQKKHEMIHTKEKPFTCDLCSKTFTRSDDLGKHRNSHKDRSILCPLASCSITLRSKYFLLNHIKTCHTLPEIEAASTSYESLVEPAATSGVVSTCFVSVLGAESFPMGTDASTAAEAGSSAETRSSVEIRSSANYCPDEAKDESSRSSDSDFPSDGEPGPLHIDEKEEEEEEEEEKDDVGNKREERFGKSYSTMRQSPAHDQANGLVSNGGNRNGQYRVVDEKSDSCNVKVLPSPAAAGQDSCNVKVLPRPAAAGQDSCNVKVLPSSEGTVITLYDLYSGNSS